MFVIGTVAGPRDMRLLDWLRHWRHRGQILVLVQASPEWLNGEIAVQAHEIAPDAEIILALPSGNADLHWNSLMAIAAQYKPEATLTCKGTDEFMDEGVWKQLKQAARREPGTACFWISYRDYFDGNHFPEMQQGPDYHPVLVRGVPLKYGVKFHTWPSPLVPPEATTYLPESIYMEHRRRIVDVLASNAERVPFANIPAIQAQHQFIERLKQVCTAKGIAWPEEEQK